MDLDEWEFLPDSWSFLEFGGGGHGSGNELFKEINFDDKMVLEMNYFICPDHSPRAPIKALVDSARMRDEEVDEEFKDIDVVPPPANQDAIAQVFFKKMKENEFVDMKMSSLGSKGTIMPLVESDPIPPGKEEEEEEQKPVKEMGIEEEEEEEEDEEETMKSDPMDSEAKKNPCLEGISVSIGRWKLTGIGALLSFGVAAAAAAATISIFVLGAQHQNHHHHHHHHHHQKIQLQIYTEDKRLKQAARLNQALSCVRGAPIRSAHISFGGYYEGL